MVRASAGRAGERGEASMSEEGASAIASTQGGSSSVGACVDHSGDVSPCMTATSAKHRTPGGHGSAELAAVFGLATGRTRLWALK